MRSAVERSAPVSPGCREIWLAGGCFWGAQEYLRQIQGVVATDVGYANGHTQNPTYEAVCSHTTGYAETVRVVYTPALLKLSFLLELYFAGINPTSVNRQGPDVGDQYRTGIYYLLEEDLPAIQAARDKLAQGLDAPVAVEVKPLENYYLAEAYHQDYLRKNPGGYCHLPKSKFAFARDAREYPTPAEDKLRQALSPIQYRVTRQSATEPPFAGEYHDHFAPGIYVDVTNGRPLFLSADKFESGCGWPAFSRPIHPEDLQELTDTSNGMLRTEVRATGSDSHLGHVFEDGPAKLGGLRYCINSAALRFVPKEDMAAQGYGHLLPLLDKNHSCTNPT